MIQKEKSTLLQFFSKNSFAADVPRSKCLHGTSSFYCIPFISESGFLIYCDDNTGTFSDVITFSDVDLNDGVP